jgi:hypothetical protein
MSHETFIKKHMNLNKCSFIQEKEKNGSKFLLGFIVQKKSKILQIGSIDSESEKMISKIVENDKYYVKMDSNDFNFNKFQKKKDFIFDTLIIGIIPKSYEFCTTYSCLFRQINYLYIHYNGPKKTCKALRCPFAKKNYHSLLKLPFEKNKENIGFPLNDKIIEYEIFKKGDVKGENDTFKYSFGKEKSSRSTIIQHLITKYKFKEYLEIGIRDGSNFNKINVDSKTGVDPEPSSDCKGESIFLMTSDEYFEYIKDSKVKFDLIFIDGLHLEEQVTKDIQNSLRHLKEGGFVIMHDCNPPTRFHQRETYLVGGKYLEWNGTTWRSYAQLRMNDPHLKMHVVNTDWGVGVIQKGTQECYPKIEELKYQDLQNNREKMLNLISVYDFLRNF